MDRFLDQVRIDARWWVDQFDLRWRLERPSMELDPTITRVSGYTLRRHPDLDAFNRRALLLWSDVLGYQARAEGPYGVVRLAALFPKSPFEGADPSMFALDGERFSLHRNPPFDQGVEGVSANLCLWFPQDPPERRWTAEYGLVELFDLARRHLAAEHVWRETDRWPTEDAPHGDHAQPVRSRPELKVAPLRQASKGT